MGIIAGIWDVFSGNRERRESRQAYLEALAVVASASERQTEMISIWLNSFNHTNAEPSKGWTVDGREEWLQEQKDEHPEKFIGMPVGFADSVDDQVSWLESQMEHL